MTENKRVLMAISGGADSAVAAALLKSQGYDLVGVHFRLGVQKPEIKPEDAEEWVPFNTFCSKISGAASDGEARARAVCEQLEIPLQVHDAQELFEHEVADDALHEYLQQRIPNPCARCNLKVKLAELYRIADERGIHHVATGHYARLTTDNNTGLVRLLRAAAQDRDETYLIYGISQERLKRLLLPLGGIPASMVDKLAKEYEFETDRRHPRGMVCFNDDEKKVQYIERRSTPELRSKGMVRTTSGSIIGEHQGLFNFRIGQKEGIPITVKSPFEFVVVGFEPMNSILVVGEEFDLFQQELTVREVSFTRPIDSLKGIACVALLAPDAEGAPCRVTCFENETAQVVFEKPIRAIVAGQPIVFYQGEECLGGGRVRHVVMPPPANLLDQVK